MEDRQEIGPLPPHGQLFGFLPEDECRGLIEWAIAQQARFKPAKVFHGAGGSRQDVRPDIRTALKLADLGPFEAVLRARLLDALGEIMRSAGYRGAEPRSIEFELNAYGDHAHFAAHRDIPTGANRQPLGAAPGEDRVISAVYYFHREPKGFSGGALRLFRIGADETASAPADSVAFEPIQNSLLVFPSWVRHAVETVHCPSNQFEDFRFALNCWLCRPLAG